MNAPPPRSFPLPTGGGDPHLTATVITDASFCQQTKAAGWAAYIRMDGIPSAIIKQGRFKIDPQHADEAEALAALCGIWVARKFGADSVLLQTDCLAVIYLIAGKIKAKRLADLWANGLAEGELVGYPIRGRHVKGHTRTRDGRSYANRVCDERARVEMRKVRSERFGHR